jgi:hypothetical protein
MKRFIFILATFIIGLGVYSCSSDDRENNPDPSGPQTSDWTVFKNQTGDPNANALQAQYQNQNETLNIYGIFDHNNNPYQILTLTYQKKDNDTLVNMIVDPFDNRINTVFFTVNGTKQPAMVKFDYSEHNMAAISYYNYDWSTKTGEMLYSCNVEIPTMQSFNAFAPNKTTLSTNWGEFLGVLGTSVAITEGLIWAMGGETVVIAALGSVAAAPIVATMATIGITVGIAVTALAIITGDANAAEPVDMPYPDGTPVQNPVDEKENPNSNLAVSDCVENALVYNVFMDGEGTIVIETPSSGGTPPYSYFLEGQSGFTDIGIYGNNYPNGEYTVAVQDDAGCITIKKVELSRDCAGSDLALTATANGNSATAIATGGVPPYSYTWSNGATGETATGLVDGEYTVTVIDDNGCNATASVMVGEELPELTGVWVIEWYNKYNSHNHDDWIDFKNGVSDIAILFKIQFFGNNGELVEEMSYSEQLTQTISYDSANSRYVITVYYLESGATLNFYYNPAIDNFSHLKGIRIDGVAEYNLELIKQ